jgi:hypothetical protein
VSRLADHRRFGRAVMLLIAAAALLLCGALLAAQHGSSLSGVVAGAVIAEADAFLLARSLTRFAAMSDRVGARALTVMMMTRFLGVSAMVGVIITAKGIDPIGVVSGFLLFPAAIVAVGIASLRSEHPKGINGAAG